MSESTARRGGVLLVLVAGMLLRPGPDLSGIPLAGQNDVRFEWVEIFIDPGEQPLAAFQFELREATGSVTIAGVEGGEHPAFRAPPYYDPRALRMNRIIIAGLSTARELPSGKTRVATVHVQVEGNGEPDYDVRLVVAVSSDGEEIPATITVGERKS